MTESSVIRDLASVLQKYFAPENLRNDIHLTQILARQQFVSLQEINLLSLVKKTLEAAEIPSDQHQEMILNAIRSIPELLTLYDNDQYVIPKIPQNRTTLILRELPEDSTQAEVEKLLDNDQCQNIKEIIPDVNSTWFVKFATEEDCVKAATWVQLTARLRGEKVRCRIKSEHSNKSYFGINQSGGNPYAHRSPYQQQSAAAVNPENDPEFMRWLQRNPDAAPKQDRARSPKGRGKKSSAAQEDDVDYPGIFKLINKQTFEMVVNRYLGNFPEGPEKPRQHGNHKFLYNPVAASGFMTMELDV